MPYKDPEAKRAWREANRERQREYNRKHYANKIRTDEDRQKEREREARRRERERASMSEYERALNAILHHMGAINRIVAEYEREAWPGLQAARLARKWATKRSIEQGRQRDPLQCRAKAARYRATKRGADGYYTPADIESIAHSQGGLCAYCDAPWEHVDHMIPLVRGGTNWPDNLQLLCAHHNTSKGAWTDAEYRMRIS